MRTVTGSGILGRIFGGRRASPPAPAPPDSRDNPHGDLERAARGFVEEHEPLLDTADPEVLARIFVFGANVFTAINPEVVAAAGRAASAKRALASAIGDPFVPPLKMQDLSEEEARASREWGSLETASQDLGGFLDRVKERLP